MAGFLIRWLEETDSTNSQISREKGTLDNFSCVAASVQRSGRGQRGNSWESEGGANLTFSLLFRPEMIHVQEQFIVSEAVALAVADYLKANGVEASIKWPNDIYVSDSKICGILIENSLDGDRLADCIIGIGLNVNQTSFSPSLPNPVSLKLITGRTFNLEDELRTLHTFLVEYLSKLGSFRERNSLDGRYLENMYRRGQWCGYEEMPASEVPTEKRSGKRFNARILGIDNSARLILERTDGTVSHYSFKEIKYI